MKETRWSLLFFSNPAVRREKCQQSHCVSNSTKFVTSVGLCFSLSACPKVRHIQVNEPHRLSLQTKGPKVYCSFCHAPDYVSLKHFFSLPVLNRGAIFISHTEDSTKRYPLHSCQSLFPQTHTRACSSEGLPNFPKQVEKTPCDIRL